VNLMPRVELGILGGLFLRFVHLLNLGKD
jgi:hypothetical protein